MGTNAFVKFAGAGIAGPVSLNNCNLLLCHVVWIFATAGLNAARNKTRCHTVWEFANWWIECPTLRSTSFCSWIFVIEIYWTILKNVEILNLSWVCSIQTGPKFRLWAPNFWQEPSLQQADLFLCAQPMALCSFLRSLVDQPMLLYQAHSVLWYDPLVNWLQSQRFLLKIMVDAQKTFREC